MHHATESRYSALHVTGRTVAFSVGATGALRGLEVVQLYLQVPPPPRLARAAAFFRECIYHRRVSEMHLHIVVLPK